MQTISLPHLAQNAYRLLGLPASATQTDVDQSARRLRIWDDPSLIPPTPFDTPWLGKIPREKNALEHAVSRLNEPESRVTERLWWFCSSPPAHANQTSTDGSITTRHDLALRDLQELLIYDPRGASTTRWADLTRRFARISKSDDYLEWLLNAESDGDFEKRANPEEIAAAAQQMPTVLIHILLSSCDDALDARNFNSLRETLRVLRDLHSTTLDTDTQTREVLVRIEDAIRRNCEQVREDVSQAWQTMKILILRTACRNAIAAIESHIRNAFVLLTQEGGEAWEIKDRARQELARTYGHLGEAFEAMEDFLAANRCYEAALSACDNTPLEPRVRAELQRIQPLVIRHRVTNAPTSANFIPGGPTQTTYTLPADLPSNKPFKVIDVPNRPARSSWFEAIPKGGAGFFLLILLLGLIRACASYSNPVTHNSNSYLELKGSPEYRRLMDEITKNPDQKGEALMRLMGSSKSNTSSDGLSPLGPLQLPSSPAYSPKNIPPVPTFDVPPAPVYTPLQITPQSPPDQSATMQLWVPYKTPLNTPTGLPHSPSKTPTTLPAVER